MLTRVLPALALGLFVASAVHADKRLDESLAKAEAQLAKGKQDEAVKILQKAASQAPRGPLAQLALAQMLARLGRLAEAAPAFAEAVQRASAAPSAVRARVLAARSGFALRAGTSQEALAFARQAVEAEAGADTLGALARALARRGDPAARPAAEDAVQAAPDSAEAHLARGDALLAARLGDQAEAAYRRALELRPASVAAGTGLALALALRGNVPQALEAARAATQMDPRFAEAEAALGLATLAQDPRDAKGEAVAAVQQARFLEPGNPLVQMALGRVFERRGQLDRAAATYAEAARLDPSWSAPRIAELDLRRRQGDVDGALTELRALPEELRASGEAQLLLGELLLKPDPRGAKTALDRAVVALPGSAEAQAAHGRAAYDVGELTLAADALGRAVRLDPGNLAYRSSHALLLAYDGRLDEGLSALLELGSAEAQTASALITLGWIYRSFEPPRVAQAVAAYQEALKLEPGNEQAALGVALSYRAGKQWERAVEAYERASTPNRRLEGRALLGIAWCYYRSGDAYKARFYTGLAARAGADVARLRDALGKPVSAVDELDTLADELRSKHAGEQVRAVKGLVRLGRPAVPYLTSALRRRTTSIAAREAIVSGLAGLGTAAGAALPSLDRLIKEGPRRASDPRESERETRLIAAIQEAAGRIRSR